MPPDHLPSEKPEFAPILVPGLHEMTPSELRRLCVDAFEHSATRAQLMDHLDIVIQQLESQGITGDLWVDGSFVTAKVDPQDIDASPRVPGLLLERLTPAQAEALRDMLDFASSGGCDLYVFPRFDDTHEKHALSQRLRAYWLGQWGFPRGDEPKGIAVISIGGGSA